MTECKATVDYTRVKSAFARLVSSCGALVELVEQSRHKPDRSCKYFESSGRFTYEQAGCRAEIVHRG
jgi:hypothetical protein